MIQNSLKGENSSDGSPASRELQLSSRLKIRGEVS